jgi:hypothetical protein
VKNAFKKAHFNQSIYTHLPPGFKAIGMAYRLMKALYGLKVSPKLWYDGLSSYLKVIGLEPCPDEPYFFIHPPDQILVFVYFVYIVNMLFIAHPSRRSKLDDRK